ncbi:MAG: hypothetical protein K1060chlam5_00601 [Candidatus Anoxychlamydiales bacterium]|nr:hypothetical protein [Candidatus Anoxychlamydiales bacterium]
MFKQSKNEIDNKDLYNWNLIYPIVFNYLNEKFLKKDLSYLLPYDCSNKIKLDLKKGLEEYQLLLTLLELTIKDYKNKNLEKFDPIVGENACQIRAVKIALFLKNNQVDFSNVESKINKAKEVIERLLTAKTITSLIQSKISLKDLLERENLNINLSSDELYLLKSYILTLTKESQPSEKTFYIQKKLFLEKKDISSQENNIFSDLQREKANPKILKNYGNITSKFSEKLFRRIRKLLSKESVNFLTKIALNKSSLQNVLKEEFVTRHLNCYSLPMFWSYKALIQVLEEEDIPIIVHAKFIDKDKEDFQIKDEKFLLYENDNDFKIHSYKKNLKDISDIDEPKIIIQGIVYDSFEENFQNNWLNSIKSFFLKHLILAGAADHRQYPDENNDYLINSLNDKEYEKYKGLADKKGFSLKNPSTFFIQHVYVS